MDVKLQEMRGQAAGDAFFFFFFCGHCVMPGHFLITPLHQFPHVRGGDQIYLVCVRVHEHVCVCKAPRPAGGHGELSVDAFLSMPTHQAPLNNWDADLVEKQLR